MAGPQQHEPGPRTAKTLQCIASASSGVAVAEVDAEGAYHANATSPSRPGLPRLDKGLRTALETAVQEEHDAVDLPPMIGRQ